MAEFWRPAARFLIKARDHGGSHLAGIKSRMSRFYLMQALQTWSLSQPGKKAGWGERASEPALCQWPPGEVGPMTGSRSPSDSRNCGQCLRRQDLNSVRDTREIRWINTTRSRRWQTC
jgi:hypothetical protein